MKMKRSMTIFFLMLIMSSGLLAQTATPPAAGNGTESNPYQIATLENLFWISQSTVRWDKYYVQTADIAAATGNWYSGAGWPMIGYFIDSTNNYPFTGSYIGNGYQITGLRINRPTAIGVGLFGYTSGAILYNIGISSGYIAGNSMVGALVGRADNTTINNCFNYDTFVQGNNTLGGLVGYLNDYSSLGHSYILTSGNIYSYARVTGTQMIGGLVGIVNGHSNVDDSYSNFTVVGSGNFIGGLVGNLWNNSSINYCYTFARVLASGDNVGGLLGSISTSSVTASYWDMEQTGQATSAGGAGAMGRTTEEMTTPYAANTYVGWDFDNTWSVDHMNFYNEGYPHLGEEIPYIQFAGGSGTSIDPWQIETPEQLRNLHYSGNIPYNTYYIQIADINLGISPWNEGEGWLPLSHGLPPARGYYNGNGFRITGLYMNRPDDEYIGLFSAIEAGAVSNLTLENVNITGKRQVAALAGEVRRGQIANCHSSGTVTGTSTEGYTNAAGLLAHAGLYFSISYSSSSCEVSGRSVVGGLIADLRYHDTQMSHCFSTGNVSGNDRIGGLIGQTSNATINNSYSTGNVVANGLSAGGLAGEASFRSSIINCYSTGSVTGDTNVGGLLGLIGISSIVLNSYSSGEVIGGGQRIGGLIGYYNNYGHDEDDSETINSYWNIETSGQTVSEGGEGRTTAQMTYPYATNTYVGWDFNEIWNADENYQFQNGYPYLGEVITIGQFAGGTGTAFNPWQIATAQQLNNVRIILGAMSSDKHYVQIANIDLGVSPWNNGDGWLPIGNSTNQFMGTYDGNGYSINGLYIYREDDQGLFGYTEGAQLKNINLNNVSVTGYENAGALVGVSINTLIENCSTTGGVNADNYAGGLVGRNLSGSVISNSHSSCAVEVLDSYGGGLVGLNNNSQINSSFSSGNITGDYQYVGGLAGRAENSSQFYGSFSTGSIYGYEMIGGLAGYVTNSTVSNCYSRGSILGNTNSGGLIGRAILSTISDSYSSGSVFGSDVTIGGLIGYIQSSSVTNSYWNMQTSGQDYSAAGSGRMTAEMTFPYDGNTYVNWDFSEIWSPDLYFSLNDGYPYLSALHSPSFAGGSGTETDPWQIATPMQLFALSFYLNVENNDKYFIQIANIDLGVAPWNVDSGWTPIGSNDFPFTGHYNGNGKTIRNLKIDRPGSNYQGLFGYLSGAVISDLILRNFDVTGSLYVGGLAGKIDANTSIDSCQVMGNVTGSSILGGLAGESVNSTISGISGTIIISGGGELIGGLLGSHNNGSISDSFTLGHVSGSEIVGGLVGSNYQSTIIRSYSSSTVNCTFEVSGGLVGSNSSSTIINSYSNGSVNGSWGSGGLVGSSNNNSILTNCYSIGLVSGTSSVGGLIGASSATTYNNCYWNTQTSGQATSAGGLGRTE